MLEASPTPTPMVTSPSLSANDGDPCLDAKLYRKVVGTLQHVCTTRPDIQFAVKKGVVSRSSIEAKFRSLANAMCEAMWIKSPLSEIGVQLHTTPILWCDNTSTIAHSANPVHHAKLKHVELDLSSVRGKVVDGSF
ncbi:cysteine-rich RLK (RECEPTOR-like protein kinase) 8 [Hibiscus trionum]|uniref:Cysteine-rich RLK (RECEPTOR-like protein kinase) 8 n=1 Tax=Hibiscus trionum TaxID=183268 RepID=A0A9W7HUM6_HIBTR|nr:cysteine-rich RLK (RECEPTOR-like protein kinase) 8 [Hibiscus trionum]